MIKSSIQRLAKWCAMLCAVCAIFAMFGAATQVQAAKAASIYGSSAKAEAGGEVTVNISISSNPGIWGLKGTVSFDSSVLTLKSASAGNVFSSSEVMTSGTSSPMGFLATGSTIADKTGNGTLLKLTFAVKPGTKLGDYSVGVSVGQAINAAEKDVQVSVGSGKVTVVSCLHKNTYTKNYLAATETAEGYSGDVYCSKCDKLISQGYVTPVWVNTCEHKNATEWTVVTEATCETDGKKELFCPDCEHIAQEEVIPKTGHEKTVIKDQKYPTTTEEGFTGNIHCEKCDALVEEGTVLEKIPILVFAMTAQPEEAYFRTSNEALVFVSDAEFETFVRVEVNGAVLDEGCYTVESGSTKVTLKPQYLESLEDGKYTITIVSDAGTASAQFQVAKKGLAQIPNLLLLIIAIVAVLLAAACVVYILLSRKSNNWNGRFSNNYGKEDEDNIENEDA